jgi:hypothetical protein
MRTILILTILVLIHTGARAQILISILLGDKLNSEKLEFGLAGGLCLSDLDGLPSSSVRTSLNLGFYFDIRLKNPSWMLHTGVMVKSAMGAQDIPVYSLDNPDLDIVFQGGSVIRKLKYFNVPVMIKYKTEMNLFFEAGPMLGLMSKAKDEFVASNSKGELTYIRSIKDDYHPLDAGILMGVGYRLMRGNGMNLGVRYYYGLVDIVIDDTSPDQYNRAIYINVGIPIGVEKKDTSKND